MGHHKGFWYLSQCANTSNKCPCSLLIYQEKLDVCIYLSSTTTLCMQGAKALASWLMCADSPEPSLLTD